VATISPRDLAKQVAEGEVELVDVRSIGEWRGGHVHGARHIPLHELGARLSELPADRPVAFICASGKRSRLAALLAARRGLAACNVAGGMNAWRRDGLPVRPGAGSGRGGHS
jgi:rhodanese-related sulfurtransferase